LVLRPWTSSRDRRPVSRETNVLECCKVACELLLRRIKLGEIENPG
jgi:hypothetical protein